jgi:hypothetical protein
MKRLIILGSGGYGHTVADVAEQLGYNILFLDDSLPDHPLSSFVDFIGEGAEFIPAFGNNILSPNLGQEWPERYE